MKLVNLTPHVVNLVSPDGETHQIPPSGPPARVSSTPESPELIPGVPVPVVGRSTWGPVEGLPPPQEGVLLIVSLLVKERSPERTDLVSPGTGPQDGAIRDAQGRITGVTRLIR